MKLLSNQQRLHQVNTGQLFDNYRTALAHAASYTYAMRWKTVRNTEYLFRDRDRRGNGAGDAANKRGIAVRDAMRRTRHGGA